jgi:hypothetical protein
VLQAPADAVAPFVGHGEVEPLDDDSCRVTTGAWSWPSLAAVVARFDADISDVEPPELVAACQLLATRLGAAGS